MVSSIMEVQRNTSIIKPITPFELLITIWGTDSVAISYGQQIMFMAPLFIDAAWDRLNVSYYFLGSERSSGRDIRVDIIS